MVRQRSEAPPLCLRCITTDEVSRFRISLVVAEHSVGSHAGWIRLVAHTPEHALKFGLRFKHGDGTDSTAHMGEVDGRNPEALFDELTTLIGIKTSDVISIETSNGQALIRACCTVLPTSLAAIHLPEAQHLTQLQNQAESVLVMPEIAKITDSEFGYLALLASIYGGTAH